MIKTIGYTSEVLPDGGIRLANSEGGSVVSQSPQELLDFMGKNYYGDDVRNHKFMYNIDTFIAPILRLLGISVCRELVKEPDCEAWFTFNGNGIKVLPIPEPKPSRPPEGVYSLFYHRGTGIGLWTKEKYRSYFWHTSQFVEEPDVVIDNPAEVVEITEKAKKAFLEMGMNPFKMASPISVAWERWITPNFDFPKFSDIPDNVDADELRDWAEEIMHRVWTTNFAVGRWDENETFHYDLSSAYGYFFSELYNYRHADFKEVRELTDCKGMTFGILKGKITINPDVKCSPICYMTDSDQLINPVDSTWDGLITLPEARFMYRWKIGTIELDRGIVWKQNAPVQPFKNIMERVYAQRAKGGLIKKLAKRIGASAWSKTIQRVNTDGENKWYSPLLALQVKTNCRLAVAEFIYRNNLQADTIYIATDGVRTTKRVNIPNEQGMGKWREEPQTPCIVVSPSRICTPEKKPGGLYYQDVVDLIEANPKNAYYATTLRRPETLGEAVEWNELDQVGVIKGFDTSVDLVKANLEQDCYFKEFPDNGKDLLTKKHYGILPKIK